MFPEEISICSVKCLKHISLIHEDSMKEFNDLPHDSENVRGDGEKC